MSCEVNKYNDNIFKVNQKVSFKEEVVTGCLKYGILIG